MDQEGVTMVMLMYLLCFIIAIIILCSGDDHDNGDGLC